MLEKPIYHLAEHEVHLWYFKTDRYFSSSMESALQYLDAKEFQRYERLLNPIKRHQFVLGRALLKQVLSWYLGGSAKEIQLLYTKEQKPYLKGDFAFNLAHSGRHVLIAVARHAIGVDVQVEETIQVEHVFQGLSVLEQQRVQRDELYRYWVLKEALWKADNNQSDPGPLLDAITPCLEQANDTFSFLLDFWCAAYLSPSQELHMGLVVDDQHPVCMLNGKPLEIEMIENLATSSRML
ncbi:4'-phosphopantetheinyl transferase family protein [Pontibacter silvestris]|uniref:4'-phosphopantetheinyl transferase family protein n=1 Tax=Pontibacter silvestris TaxID=2305183 RepID=A0ABW4X3D0_9BACT|nr:hypothetical protein [Pontibacter silvestris]MCC9138356.1 hypothetical protein [Pontibacter silvestris]